MPHPLRLMIEDTLRELGVEPSPESIQIIIDFLKDVYAWTKAGGLEGTRL